MLKISGLVFDRRTCREGGREDSIVVEWLQ